MTLKFHSVAILSSLFLFGFCVPGSSLRSETGKVDSPSSTQTEETLAFREQVRKKYEPARCFRTNFAVSMVVPGQGTQTAAGLLRADNEKHRMRMILTEPNLGITLSWITIKDGTAFVSNPRKAGIQNVPLQGFELQSLGTNNIQLPFTLFQDILYGGLPVSIYADSTDWQKTADGYSARFHSGGDSLEYRFSNDYRLRRVLFSKGGADYRADIAMNGAFYKTIFPEWFAIQTFSAGRPSETMRVAFQAVNMEAWCKDEYFPVR